MRNKCIFVFRGPAVTMPGLIFALYEPGVRRPTEYLCDSMVDAAVMARHFDALLTFDEPKFEWPSAQGIDYQTIHVGAW